MTRRSKSGNYSFEDRKMILEAAISEAAGKTLAEKQAWLMNHGVHRPGRPTEPVSESAINYWKNAHRRVKIISENSYETAMDSLLNSPPSYRALKQKIPELLSGSMGENDEV